MNRQFALGAITPQRYFFGIAVVLGLLFASVGDADDGDLLLLHVLSWQLQTVIPMAIFVGCHLLLGSLSKTAGLNPWLQLLISGSTGVLLFTPLNLSLDIWLQGDVLGTQTVVAAMLGEMLSMGPTAMISWLAINAPWVLGFRFESAQSMQEVAAADSAVTEQSQPETSLPEFMDMLPALQRGELIYLKADLHYLSVITTEGHSLLLYNLKDAIGELAGASGFQCHRSYWVSEAHIVGFKKKERQGQLLLSDGSKVPVSRNYLGQVTTKLESRDS